MPKLKSVESHSLGARNAILNAEKADLDTEQAAIDVLQAHIALMKEAAAGNMKLTISPVATTKAASAAGHTREVVITLRKSDDVVHTWFNGSFATKAAIADTSTLATATIPSTTVTFVDGVCRIIVTVSAHQTVAAETDTLTLSSIVILGYTLAGSTSVETIN